MATRNDVAKLAFRKIGVVAEDEAMTADQFAVANDLMGSIYDELRGIGSPYWTPDDVAADAFNAFASLLAVDLAPMYGRPPPTSRGYAKLQIMSAIGPDDRIDPVAEYF
jgi:hypothetical protein